MDNEKKYNCDCCKYKTDKPSDWIKHKYYCEICDCVMFNPTYYNKHLSSNRHNKSIATLNNNK